MTRQPIRKELRQMRNEMNQIVSEVLNTTNLADNSDQPLSRGARRPITELSEKEDEYHLAAELPGVNKDAIDVTITDNLATIQVKHTNTDEGDNRTRRSKSSFYEQMRLPQDVNIDDAQASYSNGVLELRLPKRSQDNARKLEIY